MFLTRVEGDYEREKFALTNSWFSGVKLYQNGKQIGQYKKLRGSVEYPVINKLITISGKTVRIEAYAHGIATTKLQIYVNRKYLTGNNILIMLGESRVKQARFERWKAGASIIIFPIFFYPLAYSMFGLLGLDPKQSMNEVSSFVVILFLLAFGVIGGFSLFLSGIIVEALVSTIAVSYKFILTKYKNITS